MIYCFALDYSLKDSFSPLKILFVSFLGKMGILGVI